MRGGYRAGAGRKLGLAAKLAEEARTFLAQRVAQEIGPLSDILVAKAKDGDIRALHELLDRAWGRPRQEVEIMSYEQEEESSPEIRELGEALNELMKIQLDGGNMRERIDRFKEWYSKQRFVPAALIDD